MIETMLDEEERGPPGLVSMPFPFSCFHPPFSVLLSSFFLASLLPPFHLPSSALLSSLLLRFLTSPSHPPLSHPSFPPYVSPSSPTVLVSSLLLRSFLAPLSRIFSLLFPRCARFVTTSNYPQFGIRCYATPPFLPSV